MSHAAELKRDRELRDVFHEVVISSSERAARPCDVFDHDNVAVDGAAGLQGKERLRFRFLAFLLGFGQGCGLCFYVGSGSYFSEVFQDPHFFAKACGLFYVPPMVVTLAQLLISQRLNARFGIRRMMQVRLIGLSWASAALLMSLGSVAGGASPSLSTSPGLVLAYGLGLGGLAAGLLGAASMFFGAVDPQLGPVLMLGQTGAGIYTNVVARAVGFRPRCDPERAERYFEVAALTVAAVGALYWCCSACSILERPYRLHEELLRKSLGGAAADAAASPASSASTRAPSPTSSASSLASATASVSPASTPRSPAASATALGELVLGTMDRRQLIEANVPEPSGGLVGGHSVREPLIRRCACTAFNCRGGGRWLGFPAICWSMALCQAIAIAMNMSLTPLANQIAHGRYSLSQEIVLLKLVADFVGRSSFFLMPTPRLGTGLGLRGVRRHAVLVWLVELVRAPMWTSVYAWATGAEWPSFLAADSVLLYAVWLPLVAMGAFSASWCTVVAMTAASDEVKQRTPLLMSSSIYAGFSVGVVAAALTR